MRDAGVSTTRGSATSGVVRASSGGSLASIVRSASAAAVYLGVPTWTMTAVRLSSAPR